MTALLVVLTILEIVLVLAVLVGYLVAITRSLRRIAVLLGKVSFGVRAIETQTEAIGPAVIKLNEQLPAISAAFGDLTGLAEARAAGAGGR